MPYVLSFIRLRSYAAARRAIMPCDLLKLVDETGLFYYAEGALG